MLNRVCEIGEDGLLKVTPQILKRRFGNERVGYFKKKLPLKDWSRLLKPVPIVSGKEFLTQFSSSRTLLSKASEKKRLCSVNIPVVDSPSVGSGLKRLSAKPNCVGVSGKSVYAHGLLNHRKVSIFSDSMLKSVAIQGRSGTGVLAVPGARCRQLAQEIRDAKSWMKGLSTALVLVVGTNECAELSIPHLRRDTANLLKEATSLQEKIPVVLVGALPRLDNLDPVTQQVNECMRSVVDEMENKNLYFADFRSAFKRTDTHLWAQGDSIHLSDAIGMPLLLRCIDSVVHCVTKPNLDLTVAESTHLHGEVVRDQLNPQKWLVVLDAEEDSAMENHFPVLANRNKDRIPKDYFRKRNRFDLPQCGDIESNPGPVNSEKKAGRKKKKTMFWNKKVTDEQTVSDSTNSLTNPEQLQTVSKDITVPTQPQLTAPSDMEIGTIKRSDEQLKQNKAQKTLSSSPSASQIQFSITSSDLKEATDEKNNQTLYEFSNCAESAKQTQPRVSDAVSTNTCTQAKHTDTRHADKSTIVMIPTQSCTKENSNSRRPSEKVIVEQTPSEHASDQKPDQKKKTFCSTPSTKQVPDANDAVDMDSNSKTNQTRPLESTEGITNGDSNLKKAQGAGKGCIFTKKKKKFRGTPFKQAESLFLRSELDKYVQKSSVTIKEIVTDVENAETEQGWKFQNNHNVIIHYSYDINSETQTIALHNLIERGFPDQQPSVCILEKSTLLEIAENSIHQIQITMVHTDLDYNSPLDLDGPWQYCDSAEVMITYTIDNKVHDMRLDNLLTRRRFVKPTSPDHAYKYYSYIRLKQVLKNTSPSTYAEFLDTVGEADYLCALEDVNEYYRKHPNVTEQEGIEEYRGPQHYEERHNRYYGKGQNKFYRFSTFVKLFGEMGYTPNQLNDMLKDPSTFNEDAFETLIHQTNRYISQRSRNTTKEQIIPYAGPQCGEDRFDNSRLTYDIASTRDTSEREAPRSKNMVMKEKIDTCNFNIRNCDECGKQRVLGERASTKYPLGYYEYNGKAKNIVFRCSNLYQVDCDSTNDIEILDAKEMATLQVDEYILAFIECNNTYRGYLLKLVNVAEDALQVTVLRSFGWLDNAPEEKALGKFGLEWLKMSRGDGYRFGVMEGNCFRTCPDFKDIFQICKVTCEPREAINCTPFHDMMFERKIKNNNNPLSNLNFEALNRVKECHSVLNSVVIFTCVKCKRECPTIEDPKSLTTLIGGKKVPLPNENLTQIIETCKALSSIDFRPSEKFKDCEVYKKDGNSLTSICQDCAPFYNVENGSVISVQLESDSQSQSTAENLSQGSVDFTRQIPSTNAINKFDATNLCSTNLFADSVLSDIPARFEALVQQMSLATKLVLTPVHMCISIHRTVSTSIPRITGGSCAFFLVESVSTTTLPWCNFKSLPFVVIESDSDDPQKILETRVDLAQVSLAFEFMSSKHICPVLGRERSFNRLLDIDDNIVWSPQQFEALRSELVTREIVTKEGERKQFFQPAGLRRVKESEIAKKKDEPFTLTLFANWLSGDGEIARHVLDHIRTRNCEDESPMDDKIQLFWIDVCKSAAVKIEHLLEEATAETNPTLQNISSLNEELRLAQLQQSITIKLLNEVLIDFGLLNNNIGQSCYLFCEELFITQSLCSNDIATNTIPKSQISNELVKDPEKIISDNLEEHALERIQERIDRQNPVFEWTDGFLQKCFPFIFLSGDFDPAQERPIAINVAENWRFQYLNRVAKLKSTVHDHVFQAVVTCLLKKLHATKSSNLYLMTQQFKDFNCPTKETLLADSGLRKALSKEVLQFANQIPDSPAFWRNQKESLIGSIRDCEYTNTESRPEKTHPYTPAHFNTIGVPYKDAPYIQRLFQKPDGNASSFERTLGAIQNPLAVSFMGCLLNELNINYIIPYVFDAIEGNIEDNDYFYYSRNEHGDNSNPHWHTITVSGRLGELVQELETKLLNKFQEEVNSLQSWSEEGKKSLKANIRQEWSNLQEEIIDFYSNTYTNWASYMTADKKHVSEFTMPNFASIDMVELIDKCLSTGDFTDLDRLFNALAFFCQRHITHTGKNGNPGKKDYCARFRKEKVRVGNDDEEEKIHLIILCKRRKPQTERPDAKIQRDPHKPKYTILTFACNDGNFNGCNIFEMLLCMGNVDTKAIVPSSFARPPKIVFNDAEQTVHIYLHIGEGSQEVEYIVKYSTKGPITPKNDSQLLLEVCSDLQDQDKFGKRNIRQMHVRLAVNQSLPIWQCSGINVNLPLYLTNLKFVGISTNNKFYCLDKSNESSEVVKHRAIDKFDKRKDDDVKFAKKIQQNERLMVRQPMSIHDFFDKYSVSIEKGSLSMYRRCTRGKNGDLHTIGLRPHRTLQNFNPSKSTYWRTCRSMCLWHKPYDDVKTLDEQFGNNEEAAAEFWVEEFERQFPRGEGLDKPFLGFYRNFNLPTEEDDNDDDEVTKSLIASLTVACTVDEVNDIAKTNTVARKQRAKTFQTRDEQLLGKRKGIGADDNCHFEDANADQLHIEANANQNADNLQECFGNHIEAPNLAQQFERVHLALTHFTGEVQALENPEDFTLNDEQFLVKFIIENYAEKVQRKEPVKALRLVVIGVPGAGKTAAFKISATRMLQLLNWQEDIRVATPTGGVAYNMGFGAQTLHKTFRIKVGHVGEPIAQASEIMNTIIKLKEHIATNTLKLIFFDEVSMVDRTMFYAIHMRLKEAAIDLSKVGIVFFGDPAQNFPVVGLPFWSLQHFCENLKGPRRKCAEKSILGIIAFREVFRMKKYDTVHGFSDLFCKSITPRHPDFEKKQELLLTYRRHAFDGDYQAVFLSKTNRSDGSIKRKKYTELTNSVRYGKWSEQKMANFYSMIASPEACAKNRDFQARKMQLLAFHHFNENEPERANVASINSKRLLDFAKEHGRGIIEFASENVPVTAESLPASEFKGIPNKLFLAIGAPVIIIDNFRDKSGLYNGAPGIFRGAYYDEATIVINSFDVISRMRISSDFYSTVQVDVWESSNSHFPKVFVKGLQLSKVNGAPVTKEALDALNGDTPFEAEFKSHNKPPHLPTYFAVECQEYIGPNFFGDDVSRAKIVLLYPTMRGAKSNKPNSRASTQNYRKNAPIELSFSKTTYKGIGDTHQYTELCIKGMVHLPGFLTTGITRNKTPEHLNVPHDQRFSWLDAKQQRLYEAVIEAECFERQCRIKSAELMRRILFDRVVKRDIPGLNLDCQTFNSIADCIASTWKKHGPLSWKNLTQTEQRNLIFDQSVDQSEENFFIVCRYMLTTDERLHLKKTPSISTKEREELMQHIASKPKKTSSRKKTSRKKKLNVAAESKFQSPTKRPKCMPELDQHTHIVSTKPLRVDKHKQQEEPLTTVDFNVTAVSSPPRKKNAIPNIGQSIRSGIENPNGHSCFVNSILQMLYCIPEEVLLENLRNPLFTLDDENDQLPEGRILAKVMDIYQQTTSNSSSISPIPLVSLLCQYKPTYFTRNEDCDAAEALFSILHCSAVGKDRSCFFFIKKITTTYDCSCDSHKRQVTEDPALYVDPFCVAEDYQGEAITWNYLLNLNLPLFETKDEVRCNCGIETSSIREFVYEFQTYMVIQISCFGEDINNKQILNLKLDNVLDLSRYNANSYKVIAIAFHIGTKIAGGHYVTYALSEDENHWLEYNDALPVTAIPLTANVLHTNSNKQPYLILLQKIV